MSDTVKLIIEISKDVFEARKLGEISPWVTVPILDAVQNGIPLDEVRKKIIKKHFSIKEDNDFDSGRTYGYEECLSILDNIGEEK